MRIIPRALSRWHNRARQAARLAISDTLDTYVLPRAVRWVQTRGELPNEYDADRSAPEGDAVSTAIGNVIDEIERRRMAQSRDAATRLRDAQLPHIRGLPVDKNGEIIWALASTLMYRELPIVMHALLYWGTDQRDAEYKAKVALNLWHGLEADAGNPSTCDYPIVSGAANTEPEASEA